MRKYCIKCNIEKSLEDFYFRKDSNTYRKACKSCLNRTLYSRNKESIKNRVNLWQKLNPNKTKSYKDKWLQNNKETRKQVLSAWQKRNKGYVNSSSAKYRADKLKATPKWADLLAIKKFYDNCPEGYEVDHIIPLRNKIACGLHVLENLQYLLISDNRKKSNKYGE